MPAAPLFTGGHGLDMGVALTRTQALKQQRHIVPGTFQSTVGPTETGIFFFISFGVQFFYWAGLLWPRVPTVGGTDRFAIRLCVLGDKKRRQPAGGLALP